MLAWDTSGFTIIEFSFRERVGRIISVKLKEVRVLRQYRLLQKHIFTAH